MDFPYITRACKKKKKKKKKNEIKHIVLRFKEGRSEDALKRAKYSQ